MSLNASLNIGRTGLLANQSALQTVGNNLANATTPGYHRQRVDLEAMPGARGVDGQFLGRGVQIQSISRMIDEALEARLRNAGSDLAGSEMRQQLLAQVEAIHGQYNDANLTSHLDALFDAFSAVANNPQSGGERMQLVEQAQTLSRYLQEQRSRLGDVHQQVNQSITHTVGHVNGLLDEIADMNRTIATSEAGSAENGSLRDRRDAKLSELAQYIDVSTNERDGQVDVHVGSTPLVLGTRSRGLELHSDGDEPGRLVVGDNREPVNPSSGELAAMMRFAQDDLPDAAAHLDTLAHELIWQVNRVHSQGQGLELAGEVTGAFGVADPDAPLNGEDAELAFVPGHGSFKVHVSNPGGDQRKTTTIGVDLEASNPSPMTMNDLVAALDGVEGLSASLSPDHRLRLSAGDGQVVSFSEDSSGVLAALGVNTFFRGDDASTIAVNEPVRGNPSRVAASATHEAGDNTNAHALAALREQPIAALNGQSLSGYWHRHVEDHASRLSGVREQAEADSVVHDNLKASQQSVSGVNVDEEAIDLLRHQRGFQASARFLTAIDEMMQTILNMV